MSRPPPPTLLLASPTTETLRMCSACGRMHTLLARGCATCAAPLDAGGGHTRRLTRVGDARDGSLFEVRRRPLSRAPDPAVMRRITPPRRTPRAVGA